VPSGPDAIAAAAAEAGISRVHALAWRDLDDVEAGGSELFVSRVLGVWADAGLDVTLRTSMAPGRSIDDSRDGYRVLRRAGRIMVFPRAITSEITRRRGPAPDALVEAWNGVPFLSPVWFRGPRVTILHHVHQHMWGLVLPPALARFGWLLESRIAPPLYRTTPIVTNSSSSRDQIRDSLRLPEANISVAPPGIDAHWCVDPTVQRTDSPSVLAVGRLMPHKHFDRLIRIAAEVRAAVPDLRLVVVGEGYERPKLEAVIDEVDGRAWVSLPGRLDDDALRQHYRSAWVVAATSIAEGFGMTLTEAAACGTPAVATRIAGHRDAVDEGRSGLLSDSAAEMTQQLISVLNDEGLRAKLSAGALERAAELTWEAAATTVFAPLADQGRRRNRRT
jgi:glycosyltransferase involved in cell wall biosynthesis